MADIYDGVLRTIIHDCRLFVLPLLNEIFGEDYNGDEDVSFYPNEHFLDQQDDPDKKRITDTSLTVNAAIPKHYHIECESSKYSSKILIRLFEYDAQIALDEHSETIDDTLIVRFPNTTVIYLRDTSSTPESMTVRIETPGGSISHEIPVLKLSNYDIEAIFNKKLYILIPFYIFNFENDFEKYKDDPEYIQSLQNVYIKIIDRLEGLVNQNSITTFDKRTIIELSHNAIKELTKKYTNIQKGMGETMSGALIDTESRMILNQGADMRNTEIAEEMIMDSEPIKKIQKYTKLSLDALQDIAKRLGKTLVM